MDCIVHWVANSWTQLSDFHFHFSSSLLSAMTVVSSAYLRLLIFLPAILIPACASSSPTFHMMYSAYKLNKQGDNIQPWCTPFPIWHHSGSMIVPQFSSVQSLSRVWLLRPHESQHARPPCPSPTPRVHPNSCPSSRWCHAAISSFVIPFSSYPQSLPASGTFPMSQLFTWGGQSIGVSALASVFPKNSQDWSPLGWTGWISLKSKGLARVFSNTTVQKHQFFSAHLSSQSNFNIHRWPLEKP